MPMVKCLYCGEKFDRDKCEYVHIVKSRRYAHATCAQKEAEKDSASAPEAVNPETHTICFFCKQIMEKDNPECERLPGTRYAHKKCIEKDNKRVKTDKEMLDEYIMYLFDVDFVPPGVNKQIKDYSTNYNFTHSGILKTLRYMIRIKQKNIDATKQSIALVPFYYKEALKYYQDVWMAVQMNQKITICVPKEREVYIKRPKRKMSRPVLFSFLDEEELENK